MPAFALLRTQHDCELTEKLLLLLPVVSPLQRRTAVMNNSFDARDEMQAPFRKV